MSLNFAAGHIDESVATVVSVATHPDERRFEISGGSIRALYGHSVPVEMESRRAVADSLLFHGTSMEAAAHILGAAGGIRRKTRQWVHLASEADDAYSAALRKGRPVVLVVASVGLSGLMSSTRSTVLAPYVPPDRVRLAPISAIWSSVS